MAPGHGGADALLKTRSPGSPKLHIALP
jgi:hypothetical protein